MNNKIVLGVAAVALALGLGAYEGCTVDPKFITAENLQEAIDTLPNAAARKNLKTVEACMEGMRGDADMKRRFRDLE